MPVFTIMTDASAVCPSCEILDLTLTANSMSDCVSIEKCSIYNRDDVAA